MLSSSAGAPAVRSPAVIAAVALAFVLWVGWTAVTYLLEGRVLGLLRPEAVGVRVLYLLVANVAIGTVAAAFVLRRLVRAGVVTSSHVGFAAPARTLVAVLAGGGIGFALYVVQGPPTLRPAVLLNGIAHALPVSIAEVMVCWAVLGGALEGALTRRIGRWGTAVAALTAAVLFGVYHFAHSPPFNTLPIVMLLTAVGVMTSVFFFVSRDVYGTIVFHNFMAILGVLRAIAEAGRLDAFAVPQAARIVGAAIAVAALIMVHLLCLRSPRSRYPAPPC